jgi:hypothetical protein
VSNIEGMTALQKRFAAITDTRKQLGQIAILGAKEAKRLVPRKTGNLGRTIRLGTVTATNATIMAGGKDGVGYARYVEFGTKGGAIIVPKRKKVLAWGGDRRLSGSLRTGAKADHFAMRVTRGATQAKPYLVPGAKRAVEKAGLADAIITAWNGAA